MVATLANLARLLENVSEEIGGLLSDERALLAASVAHALVSVNQLRSACLNVEDEAEVAANWIRLGLSLSTARQPRVKRGQRR